MFILCIQLYKSHLIFLCYIKHCLGIKFIFIPTNCHSLLSKCNVLHINNCKVKISCNETHTSTNMWFTLSNPQKFKHKICQLLNSISTHNSKLIYCSYFYTRPTLEINCTIIVDTLFFSMIDIVLTTVCAN